MKKIDYLLFKLHTLHGEDTYFKTKLIEAGFSESDFKAKNMCTDEECSDCLWNSEKCPYIFEIDYLILKSGDENHEIDNSYLNEALLVYIGDDIPAIRKIIEKTGKEVNVFKDETVFFYFLYCEVLQKKAGVFHKFEVGEFLNEFASNADDVKIIDCVDLFEPVDIREETEAFSFCTLPEEATASTASMLLDKILEFYPHTFPACSFFHNEHYLSKFFYVRKNP